MAEPGGGERNPPGQTTEDRTKRGEQGGPRPESKSNALLRQGSVFDKLRQVPPTEEPAFWPNRVMAELEYRIDPGEHPDSPFARQWAPLRQSLQRIRKAYEVLAYPHCRYEGWREEIEGDLTIDREVSRRDKVELNDTELGILRDLADAGRVPFNPEKRVYNYSEVFNPSPDTPKALTGAQWIAEQARANAAGNKQKG